MAKKDKRIRYQWRFWLDAKKDDELLMCEALDGLKSRRQYASSIRNALKLFFDLMQGKTDELNRQFPNVVESLKMQAADARLVDVLATQTVILEHLEVKDTGWRSSVGFVASDLPELPSPFDQDEISIVDAVEARATFAGAMGDLFGDDLDNLWD